MSSRWTFTRFFGGAMLSSVSMCMHGVKVQSGYYVGNGVYARRITGELKVRRKA